MAATHPTAKVKLGSEMKLTNIEKEIIPPTIAKAVALDVG